MSYQFVEVGSAGGVGRLTIANGPLNVLTIAAMEEAVAGLRELESDREVKVIVAGAAGTKAFSAGVDVADHTPEKMDHMLGIFNELCLGLRHSPKPTIAAVRRMALGGGCELAACCDMVIASDQATFGQPEIKVGVYPVLGVALFAQILGQKAANELLLSGMSYTAEEARAFGLVNRVVPDDRFDAEVEGYVGRFLGNSGLVMSLTKKAILASAGKETMAAVAAAEDIYVRELMVTADANEGLQAFIGKRKAVWTES